MEYAIWNMEYGIWSMDCGSAEDWAWNRMEWNGSLRASSNNWSGPPEGRPRAQRDEKKKKATSTRGEMK
eukprot:8800556-Pyramimonas_sp.AAC.1